IRSRLDIPVVYLTAYSDASTLQRAKITEPYGYIIKPFQERELHIIIEIALYKHGMERKLREREEWFATTLMSIGDGVIATDRNGLINFMNAAAEQLTGWKQEEAMNRKLTEVFKIINRDTRQSVENPVARVLLTGEVVGLANHTMLITRDGTEIPIDDRATPIRNYAGNLTGVALIFRDVSERDRVERLKDDFIGMVSHELKTPMTVIMGALHVLTQEGLSERETRELLRDAISGTETMAAIVENLLELSRSQANHLILNMEPIDVFKIARDVTRKLQGKSATHRLTVDAPTSPVLVLADPVKVERILYNLVENAIKYSPRGGEIRIFSQRNDNKLILGVSDQGPGIPPEGQKRLFQSFEQLETIYRNPTQGVGLGLKVCRTLVEAHGEKIWVESEPGKGATFLFTLPFAHTARNKKEYGTK
ncbi:MAG: ATP-binding protein, partial [Dehalococcoidales bacterium]|nr:ATP-binding protein [Dehalococcoidales bacterium]